MKLWFATIDGLIFSYRGKGGNNRTPWVRPIAGQLACRKHRQGYLTVSFQGKQKFIHRLVWEEFNGTIPEGLEINHINGIKSDNRLSNLELVTRSENIKHAFRMGLNSFKRKPNAMPPGYNPAS